MKLSIFPFLMFAVLLAALPLCNVSAQNNAADKVTLGEYDQTLMDRINAYRAQKKRPPLKFSPLAWQLAHEHTLTQCKTRNLSHNGVNKRYSRAKKQLGKAFLAAAENVAMCGEGYDDVVETIFQGWRHSKVHNQNMLNKELTHAGLSGAQNSKGEWYFTHFFLTIKE